MRAGIRIDRRRIRHLDRFGRHLAAGGGDLSSATSNPSSAHHPRGPLLDAVARLPRRAGRCSHVLRDRPAATAGFMLGHPADAAGLRVSDGFREAVKTDLVVDGARDLHADVVLFPRPAGGDGVFVEQHLVYGPPLVDDLVPQHPVLVGRIHGQQVNPTHVRDSRSVGCQQARFAIAWITNQGRHVVLDFDRSDVVDAPRAGVIKVEQCRRTFEFPGRHIPQRPPNRLVHERLFELVLPVPRARVVVDGQRVGECRCQRRCIVRLHGLEVSAVGRGEVPLPAAALEPCPVLGCDPIVHSHPSPDSE